MKSIDKQEVQGGLNLPTPSGATPDVQLSVKAPAFNGFEWRSTREPNYHVFVFNISERTFTGIGNIRLEIPGLNVLDRDGKSHRKTLPGLEDKPYRPVTSFPQPMLFSKENHDTNQFEIVEQDVRKFVVALISPQLALSGAINLDMPVDPNQTFSQGCDLARAGVFFDYKEVPSRVELEKAYARMERYYNALLEQARTLGMTDKPQFENQLRENPDYRYAADFVGEEFDWHRKSARAVECVNCGEKKTTKKPFHKTSDGFLCVDPSKEAWKAAYNVGLVQKDRVPEDFRWFEPAKP